MQKAVKKSNPSEINPIYLSTDSNGIVLEASDQAIEIADSVEAEILQSFFCSSPQPTVAYLPTTGEIIYVNPAFTLLYGYSFESIRGKSIAVLHEKNISASFINKTYLSKRNDQQSVLGTNVKSDHSVFEVELNTGVVTINDQNISLLYIKDISEKLKAETQSKLTKKVLKALQKQNSFRQKLDDTIEVVREFLNWNLGELWLFSYENKYSTLESYSVDEFTADISTFIESSLQLKICFESLQDTPAYKDWQPLWIPDLRDNKFLSRSEQAIKANFKGLIVLPLMNESKLVGGIILFSTEVQEINHTQFEILTGILSLLTVEIEHQKIIDQYHKFFELSGDMFCIGDLDWNFWKTNSSFLELLGYTEKEVIGRSFYEYVHIEDKDKLGYISQRLLIQEEVEEFELRFRKSSGEYVWVAWSVSYSFDHHLLFAAGRDVSDTKLAEEIHYELDEIVEHASEVIFKLDQEGRITFASSEFERLFKFESTELIGLHFTKAIHPDDIPLCMDAFQEALKTREPVRNIVYRTKDKDGTNIWMNTSIVFVFDKNNQTKYCIGLAQNITSQRETLKKLEDAEQRYAAFLEHSSEAIWRIETKESLSVNKPFEEILAYYSEHGYLAECNKMFCSIYGYSNPDEMNGMKLSRLMPLTEENNIQYFRSFVQNGFNLSNAESIEYDKEGNKKFILNNLVGIIENGQLIRIWGTQRDVTNLRIAQKEIANREEQYRTLAENVPMLILRLDRDICLTYTNRALELLFKLDNSSVIGKSFKDIGLDASVYEEITERSLRVFQLGIPDNFTIKVPSPEAPGKMFNLLVNLVPELDDNQEWSSIILIAHEISPIIEAQEALIYKDKLLASITSIAGQLLREENYRQIIGGALQQLGMGTKADRAFIFENQKSNEGELYSCETYEWCNENINPQINKPIFQKVPFGIIADYYSRLDPEVLCFELTTEETENAELKAMLYEAEVKSMLVAPILVGSEFWGFIGFDECHFPRIWSEVDKDILKTFASCLAAAIQRKRVEEVVQESEARFKHMADNAPVMIWVSDQNDQTVYVNKNWTEFTGINLATSPANFWHDLVHPHDINVAITQFGEVFAQHLSITMEYRMKAISGEFRWVIDQATPRFLSDGTFVGYIGTTIDIHDRKLTEEKISFQARVMQEITEAIISTDLDFNVLTWNKGAEKIHGILAKDIIGKKITDFFEYNYLSQSREFALDHLSKYGHWSGEIYYNKIDNPVIYLFSSLSFISNNEGDYIGIVEVQREITEKKKSEEALQISEERYRTVVNALSEGIMLIDQSGKLLTYNKSAELLFRLTPDSNNADPDKNSILANAIHEDGSVFLQKDSVLDITLKTGSSTYGKTIGIPAENGEIIWLSINTEPLFFSSERTKPDAMVLSFADITQKKKANEELARNERQLREYSDRINNILDSITDGFIAVDNEMRIFLWNHVFERVTEIKAKNAIGRKLTEVFPNLFSSMYESFADALSKNKAIVQEYFSHRYNLWFEVSAFPSLQGLFIYFRDISKRKNQELLLGLEKEVLELNAKPHVTLKRTLDFFLIGMEKVFQQSIITVLGLKEDGKTIETFSAPHFPQEFSESINGKKIDPKKGSCGAAMFLKKNVIVSDIANDELWDNEYRAIALQYNFKACWSFPILSSQNKVLASMAIYCSTVKSPSQDELTNIQRAVSLLRVIIENKQSEEKIKMSNERYLLATLATNDAIWDWDMASDHLYWGEGFHGLFGYKAGNFKRQLGNWENAIHPGDRERVLQSFNQFTESNSQQVWQEEYRFRKADGKYVLVADRGFLIFNQHGKLSRMVGSIQDITEKREMEKKLLKQEINKQKLVAQAVVDAQEKERSLIGKELHDNINQILSTAKLYLEVAKNDENERANLIDMSTQGISDAINKIRSISHSLVPSSIGDLGLIDSVLDLVESIKMTRKLKAEFHYDRYVDEILTEPQKLMLFRIAQEQVNNVMKHANAKNLVIQIFVEDKMVVVSISDDGDGFNPDQLKNKKGVGLFNISSRAELFNGKVDIISAPGKGCTLLINVPITNL